MQARKRKVVDGDVEPARKKSFFERNPGVKWALIGLAIGLFAAAIAVPLVVTIGPGLAPFVAIGIAMGLTDAVLAGTAGIAVVAAVAMLAVSTILGSIAAIASHFRRSKEPTVEAGVSLNQQAQFSSRELSNDDIAKQQAELRASSTPAAGMFSKTEEPSDTTTLVETPRLV